MNFFPIGYLLFKCFQNSNQNLKTKKEKKNYKLVLVFFFKKLNLPMNSNIFFFEKER